MSGADLWLIAALVLAHLCFSLVVEALFRR